MYRSTTLCRMAQCRETILKMEEWSTNSTVKRGSVSMALLSSIVTKDSGIALHQAVSQMVSISESCPALFTCSIQQQQQKNFIPLRRITGWFEDDTFSLLLYPTGDKKTFIQEGTVVKESPESEYKGFLNSMKISNLLITVCLQMQNKRSRKYKHLYDLTYFATLWVIVEYIYLINSRSSQHYSNYREDNSGVEINVKANVTKQRFRSSCVSFMLLTSVSPCHPEVNADRPEGHDQLIV